MKEEYTKLEICVDKVDKEDVITTSDLLLCPADGGGGDPCYICVIP